MTAGTTVLFLDKVFLKGQGNTVLRGVEVFNIALVREMAELGCRVTMPVAASWAETIRSAVSSEGLTLLAVPDLGGVFQNSLGLLFRRVGRHEVLLLGNVGNGLVPAVRALHWRGAFSRCVLIAHREASSRFVGGLRRIPTDVLAVNSVIARPFLEAGYTRVDVMYGVMNADAFYPLPRHKPEEAGLDFCVIGQLNNAWKGADTAVEAFRRLPGGLRDRSRLHLASFSRPPEFPEKNIIPYRWMPLDEMAEFLRKMDVMIVPSRDEVVMRETFSQAMVQGMLTGLPILASALPVLMEKLDRGGGVTFNSIDELAGAMIQMAGDPALRRRLGEQGRKTALERYVWDTPSFVDDYLLPAAGGDAGAETTV